MRQVLMAAAAALTMCGTAWGASCSDNAPPTTISDGIAITAICVLLGWLSWLYFRDRHLARLDGWRAAGREGELGEGGG